MVVLLTFIDHVRVWSIRVRSCIGYDAISDSDLYSREITADCVFQLHRQTDRQTDRQTETQRDTRRDRDTQTERQTEMGKWFKYTLGISRPGTSAETLNNTLTPRRLQQLLCPANHYLLLSTSSTASKRERQVIVIMICGDKSNQSCRYAVKNTPPRLVPGE